MGRWEEYSSWVRLKLLMPTIRNTLKQVLPVVMEDSNKIDKECLAIINGVREKLISGWSSMGKGDTKSTNDE